MLRLSAGRFGDIKLTYDTGVLVLTKELAVDHFSFDLILEPCKSLGRKLLSWSTKMAGLMARILLTP